MSFVANIIIVTVPEDEGMKEFNSLMSSEYEGSQGSPFSDLYDICEDFFCAGTKGLEVGIYTGAFNYLNLDNFIELMNKTHWEFPEGVSLFVQDENEVCMTQREWREKKES